MYVGYNCFIIWNKNEVWGPYNPTQASPSDPTLPSAHAEVVAVKDVLSKKSKKTLKKAKLALVRWGYNKNKNDWELSQGVPCEDCCKFLSNYNFKSFIISTYDNSLIDVDFDYLKQNTKKSTGRLYGK